MAYALTVAPLTGPLVAVPLIVPVVTDVLALPSPPLPLQATRTVVDRAPRTTVSSHRVLRALRVFIAFLRSQAASPQSR
jgi:hypothetical protein